MSNVSNRGLYPGALADAGFVDGATDLPADDIAADYALLHEQLRGMISFLRRRRGWLSPSKVICWQRNDLQETSRAISTTGMATTRPALVSVIE
ncbi:MULTISPECIES: hypothetical protein [Bradyrhizobium]|uniref:hypothetical protein n=1 Tax=Bradyrhizobium TaxID=374 RepID=UPI000B81BC11|nr:MULTISPECIES: hypothetical protein [Bradyrhizobium]